MTTTTAPVSTDQLIHDLIVAERAAQRAEERSAALKAELIERLGVDGKYETDEAKVAVVVAKTKVIDVDALKVVARPGLFRKLTKVVVNVTAYNALLAVGEIPTEVQEIVVERENKPSLRLTAKV